MDIYFLGGIVLHISTSIERMIDTGYSNFTIPFSFISQAKPWGSVNNNMLKSAQNFISFFKTLYFQDSVALNSSLVVMTKNIKLYLFTELFIMRYIQGGEYYFAF